MRSARAFEGYWTNPELTAPVLRDGGVVTGDLRRLDEQGYLSVVDRIKEMTVVFGDHLYSRAGRLS
ncbi:hypothetical protein [Streptomyces californicus]|uniref:hypothetical protein n=1 Tax=Streptomyces californicus TaxID=67351 RepID=UPI00371E65A2